MRVYLFVSLVFLTGLFLAPIFGLPSNREDRLKAIQVSSGAHLIPSQDGVTVVEPNSGERIFFPKIEQSANKRTWNGWATSLWFYGSAFTNFTATWTVPPIPSTFTDGQVLYFFNSLQNTAVLEIIQPVLEWNDNLPGWSLACWYGTGSDSSNYYYSSPVPALPGDTITGNIYQSGSEWLIEGSVNGILGTSISVAFTSISETQSSAQLVLEAYNINECSDYPSSNSISFTNIAIEEAGTPVSPWWRAEVFDHSCGEGAITGPIPTLVWES